jgi:DnaJ-class molecular chaperone
LIDDSLSTSKGGVLRRFTNIKNLRKYMDKYKWAGEPVVKEKTVKKKVVKEDRSAFNCPDCKGEGLNVAHTQRCVKCGGTGKV